jgi:type II secretory pathway pseudopilin PulG
VTNRAAGFSLVEVLMATAIVLTITALACALAMEAQTAWRADNARVDLQQRARVAADTLTRALLESGAGPLSGVGKGPLVRVVPPVMPRRIGVRGDPPVAFRTDAVSLLHAVAESEHATLLIPAPAGVTTIDIAASSCALPTCGFSAGTTVLVHDGAGNYDVFSVIAVSGLSLAVRHHGSGSVVTYPAGSPLIAVASSSFYLDGAANILRVSDGDGSDLPLIDDVVGVEVEYSGVARPPVWPRPAVGQANCLYDAEGAYRASLLPVLGAEVSRIALGKEVLTDGPWCGSGANLFDADLLRVRRIRMTLRLQASDPAVRGLHPLLFREPGTARQSGAMVPDWTMPVDVAPRNLREGW